MQRGEINWRSGRTAVGERIRGGKRERGLKRCDIVCVGCCGAVGVVGVLMAGVGVDYEGNEMRRMGIGR